MSISRRQFIAGAGVATAGLIVPSFAARVLAHVATYGEPLLEPVSDCARIASAIELLLNALTDRAGMFSTQLPSYAVPNL